MWIIAAVFWVIIIALNIISWRSEAFSTWYTDNLTMFRVTTYGRLTGLLHFSIGEYMLICGIILVVLFVILSILYLFLFRRQRFRAFVKGYYRTFVCILTIVCMLMTLNCTILYHAKFIDANPDRPSRQYSVEELKILRDYIVEQANAYSTSVERGDDGYAVYSGDMQQTAKDAMNSIADIYPRLSGYYPDVKPMLFSSLMCQMYMSGYYFPFSMEANANSYMYIMNVPQTYCHELSHLHGYIYEDEANFIAFLACINSYDDFFRYSGYLSVLNYVYNAYWEYITDWDEYARQPQTNELVDRDNIFVTDDIWHKVEEESVLDTDTVSEVSETITDSTLKINGVEDGMASYSRVVGLLLEYYDGILY